MTGRPKYQMGDVRPQSRMPDERQMELKPKVRSKDHRVDREDMSADPGARRLALDRRALHRQVEVSPWAKVHILQSTVGVRRVANATGTTVRSCAPSLMRRTRRPFKP